MYSKYVGNVFGAPLAVEGLAAFFLESTFLGLWLFGWGRLPKRVHLATIWAVSIGTLLSAMFILIANSWMQHPVGYTMNQTTHEPQLNNILAVFTNPTFLWGYVHVILASLVTLVYVGYNAFLRPDASLTLTSAITLVIGGAVLIYLLSVSRAFRQVRPSM